MDYHMESKLATLAFKFQELERELNEVDDGITWNELCINYSGHPLQNIDEYVDDVKAGVYDEDEEDESNDVCAWYDEEKCGDCERTLTDWIETCKRDDELAEHEYRCESCNEGIMHVTFNKNLHCSKCYFEMKFDDYKAKYSK